MTCNNCGLHFEASRKDAKFCSPGCRKEAFQKRSVGTDNVELAERIIPEVEEFEFTIKVGQTEDEHQSFYNDSETVKDKSRVRTAKYWYDVPLAAVPKLKKGWPEMPEYMNGRQYFLWWKNNFEVKKDKPVIHNPFPVRDNVIYVRAAEGSRLWGA